MKWFSDLSLFNYFFFIENEDASHDFWLGATDLGVEGVFKWMESEMFVEDFIWHSDQPDGGITQNCMYWENGGARDASCDGHTWHGDSIHPLCQQVVEYWS